MSRVDEIRARLDAPKTHGDYASWDDIEFLLAIVDAAREFYESLSLDDVMTQSPIGQRLGEMLEEDDG